MLNWLGIDEEGGVENLGFFRDMIWSFVIWLRQFPRIYKCETCKKPFWRSGSFPVCCSDDCSKKYYATYDFPF